MLRLKKGGFEVEVGIEWRERAEGGEKRVEV